MNENRKFGKLDGGSIIYAPRSFEHGGIKYNLTNRAEIYAEMGYLPVLSTEMPEGDYAPVWKNENGVLKQKWEEVREE